MRSAVATVIKLGVLNKLISFNHAFRLCCADKEMINCAFFITEFFYRRM